MIKIHFFRKDEKLGSNDHSLMQRLSSAGTEHRKYMRMVSRIQEWREKSERGEFLDEPLIFTIFYLLVGIFLMCLGFFACANGYAMKFGGIAYSYWHDILWCGHNSNHLFWNRFIYWTYWWTRTYTNCNCHINFIRNYCYRDAGRCHVILLIGGVVS